MLTRRQSYVQLALRVFLVVDTMMHTIYDGQWVSLAMLIRYSLFRGTVAFKRENVRVKTLVPMWAGARMPSVYTHYYSFILLYRGLDVSAKCDRS